MWPCLAQSPATLAVPDAPCMVYLPLFTYIWVIFGTKVDKVDKHFIHEAYVMHICVVCCTDLVPSMRSGPEERGLQRRPLPGEAD